MAIKITSTTGTPEEVLAATGDAKPKEEPKEDKKQSASENSKAESDEKLEASDASKQDLEESDDESEAQEAQGEEDSQDEETRPKKKINGFKKRIDKLNKRFSKKEQEAEYWKQQALKGLSSQESKSVEAKKEPISGKPKAEDFDTHEGYIDAVTDWKLEQREKEREMKAKETQVKTEFQKQVESFQAKVTEFKESHEDFDEVLSEVDDIVLSIGLHDAIMTSEFAPQVQYALAKNRKEFERINGLSAIAAAREIGKIEARFSGTEKQKEEKQEIKKTNAPPPIKPVGSSSSGSTKKSLSDPNLSQSEYEALRRKQSPENRA